ncbi:hypothetical protein Cgig2_003395 [Carnegiea gigantea]|uniref:Uncharacterized protein n=1 Tax=Carnegiea gigantea TaxID=171969 RepID=A0A9Q1Q3W8_9CARY|nr:hypothetical protein Cgig2_003395 [Carnegiea gigantea]
MTAGVGTPGQEGNRATENDIAEPNMERHGQISQVKFTRPIKTKGQPDFLTEDVSPNSTMVHDRSNIRRTQTPTVGCCLMRLLTKHHGLGVHQTEDANNQCPLDALNWIHNHRNVTDLNSKQSTACVSRGNAMRQIAALDNSDYPNRIVSFGLTKKRYMTKCKTHDI